MIFIYILIIITILVCALAFILPAFQAKKCNLITDGTIISIRCEKRRMNNYEGYSIFYFPTFKFIVDGKEYVKESFSAVCEDIYREGQQIKIAYYEENPMDAIILTDKKSKVAISVGLTIFAILGGSSIILGSLYGGILSHGTLFLLAIGFIALITCYFISKK